MPSGCGRRSRRGPRARSAAWESTSTVTAAAGPRARPPGRPRRTPRWPSTGPGPPPSIANRSPSCPNTAPLLVTRLPAVGQRPRHEQGAVRTARDPVLAARAVPDGEFVGERAAADRSSGPGGRGGPPADLAAARRGHATAARSGPAARRSRPVTDRSKSTRPVARSPLTLRRAAVTTAGAARRQRRRLRGDGQRPLVRGPGQRLVHPAARCGTRPPPAAADSSSAPGSTAPRPRTSRRSAAARSWASASSSSSRYACHCGQVEVADEAVPVAVGVVGELAGVRGGPVRPGGDQGPGG